MKNPFLVYCKPILMHQQLMDGYNPKTFNLQEYIFVKGSTKGHEQKIKTKVTLMNFHETN